MLTNPLFWIIGVVLLLVILSIAGAWGFARLWASPRELETTISQRENDLPVEEIEFESVGHTLRGWFIRSPEGEPPWPTVLLVHGWSRDRFHMLPLARALHNAGFAIVMADARGHGASDGGAPVTIRAFVEDILATFQYARGRADVEGGRIGVLGHSFGAAAALLAVGIEPRIKAVASLAAFADPVQVARRALRHFHLPRGPFLWLVVQVIERWAGISLHALSPSHRSHLLRHPTLLLHGGSDRMIPNRALDEIATGIDPHLLNRRTLPGQDHGGVLTSNEAHEEIIHFFKKSLDRNPRAKISSAEVQDPLYQAVQRDRTSEVSEASAG